MNISMYADLSSTHIWQIAFTVLQYCLAPVSEIVFHSGSSTTIHWPSFLWSLQDPQTNHSSQSTRCTISAQTTVIYLLVNTGRYCTALDGWNHRQLLKLFAKVIPWLFLPYAQCTRKRMPHLALCHYIIHGGDSTIQGWCAIYGIYRVNSDLTKYRCSSITSVLVAQTLRRFAQSTALIMPWSLQNFKTIR